MLALSTLGQPHALERNKSEKQVMRKILSTIFTLVLTACASTQSEPPVVLMGTILTIHPHEISVQQPNLAGAVVGGLAGGAIGHQFGQGDGKTAMTIIGVVAGATAGSQVNKKESTQQVLDLGIQMPDGKVINITTPSVGFQPGQVVKIVQQGHKAMIEAVNN